MVDRIFLILIFFIIFSLPLPASADLQVRVGVFPVKPLIFMSENDSASGINADLINKIAEENDWEIIYVPGSWNDGLERIQSGEIDLITSVMYTKERDKFLEYSQEPFFTIWGEAYVRPDSGIANILDLDGQNVALMKGDQNGKNFRKLAEDFHVKCNFIELPSHKEVFTLVKDGNAAAGIAPNIFGIVNAPKFDLVDSPIIFGPSHLYYAVVEGGNKELIDAIDESLRHWKSDKGSSYYSTLRYWLSDGVASKEVIPRWVKVFLIAAACLAIFLYTWSCILKSQVQAKTKALKESKHKYWTLLTNQNDAMFLHQVLDDGYAKFSEVNTQTSKLYGYSKEELSELTIKDIYTPDALADLVSLGEIDRLKSEGRQVFESTHRNKSGKQFPVEVSATVVELENDRYFLSFARDISARKQAEDTLQNKEHKFRTLFEHVVDYALVTQYIGEDLIIVDLNESACRHHGYTREELVGQSIGILDPVPVNPDDVRLEKLKAGETLNFEVTHRRKNGSIFPVEVLIKAIEIDGAEVFFAIERDITLRKQAEEQHQILEAQLRQKYKMEAVGMMAGGVAHDFNNILSIILTNMELSIRKLEKESPILQRVTDAKLAALRGSELVKQILTYSRQEESLTKPVQFAKSVESSLRLLRSTIPSTIEILNQVGTDTHSAIIQGDPIQLEEIVINLCQNAVHAMGDKGLLTVALEKRYLKKNDLINQKGLAEGEFFVLKIEDTGPGIPSDVVDKIFDPFFTTKATGEGTGMGLSICHGIVNRHNGFIDVTSSTGQGSCFSVYLPITGTHTEVENNQFKETTGNNLTRGNEHILLVDDEEYLVKSIADILRSHGYIVTTQTSGKEALELFKKTPNSYHMVISDQTMPEMTGMELSAELLKLKSDVPIILCTGYSSSTNEEKAKEVGIRAFFLKPLSNAKLLQTMRDILDN